MLPPSHTAPGYPHACRGRGVEDAGGLARVRSTPSGGDASLRPYRAYSGDGTPPQGTSAPGPRHCAPEDVRAKIVSGAPPRAGDGAPVSSVWTDVEEAPPPARGRRQYPRAADPREGRDGATFKPGCGTGEDHPPDRGRSNDTGNAGRPRTGTGKGRWWPCSNSPADPRRAGTGRAHPRPQRRDGNTPTGMGTASSSALRWQSSAANPHARGDRAVFGPGQHVTVGEPPRAWGQNLPVVLRRARIRRTPGRPGTARYKYRVGRPRGRR